MTSLDCSDHFSDRNIPFGVASSQTHPAPQCVTRLANSVLYLSGLAAQGLFKEVEGLPEGVFAAASLNDFAALPKSVHRAVQSSIRDAFQASGGVEAFPQDCVEDVSVVTMHLPVRIGDFTDFSCSLEHVKNAGRIVAKSDGPPPSFFNFPVAYQGRASSIVVSGTAIERPMGQYRDKAAPPTSPVIFAPSRAMDYELEFAAVVGKPVAMRQRLRAADADEHIFGFVLLNDWSARDIQGFEMNPLGPLNGKNSGTSISPWIVTLDTLAPFRVPGPPRVIPVPPHLDDPGNCNYSIRMQVEILAGPSATTTGTSEVQSMYWTTRQMAAHIVSAGSALRTGDLLATGTVSGPGKGAHGCLLEATEGGTEPIQLADGSARAYLEDGDVVRMTAVAGEPSAGIGWGECVGQLTPARPF